MADRYCKDCGQELWPEDRFCAGCGRTLHATAHVPTPEADVPVPSPDPPPQEASAPAPTPEADVPLPPPPDPAGGNPQTAGSEAPPAEEAPLAPPSQSQAHQRPVGRWQLIRHPILWFLGSLIAAGLLHAFRDAPPGEFGFQFWVHMITALIVFGPLWLISGGFFYLLVRLLGRKPSIPQVIFNRYLTIPIIILVLASGVLL